MTITFTAEGTPSQPAITLATEQRGTGVWCGPDNLRRDGQRVVQTVQPIGAPRVTHHSRKNRTGSVTFAAKCECASYEAAIQLAATYDDTLPTERGTLKIGTNAITGAIIQSVTTHNTGVTVYAQLTIVF